MITVLSRWCIFAVMFSLLLIYFKGGTLLVKDGEESIRSTKSLYCLALIAAMSLIGLAILGTQFLICLGYLGTEILVNEAWAVLAGLLITIISLLTSCWCRFRFLKNYWSGNVAIKPAHQVVDNGPYGVVRHPIYATTLGTYSGICLSFAIWWNWLMCLMMIVGYILLVAYEDYFLIRNLPGYTSYCRRVRFRMIPGVW